MTIKTAVFLINLLWALLIFIVYFIHSRYLKEKEEAKQSVEYLNRILEIRVKAKTKQLREQAERLKEENKGKTEDLKEQLEDLEKFHRLTVGRELKMTKLKKKIRRLKKELEGCKKKKDNKKNKN